VDLANVAQIDCAKLPWIYFGQRRQLPVISAIYFALDAAGDILYIGKAKNLKERWRAHHRQTNLQEAQCLRIAWLSCDASLAAEIEYALIQHYNPPFNSHVGMAPPPKPIALRESTTVRLTPNGRRLLLLLSEKLGLTATSVIELAIREKAARERIK